MEHCQKLEDLIKISTVPEFCEGFNRPCTDHDFSAFVNQSAERLNTILKLTTDDFIRNYCTDDVLMLLINIIGENRTLSPWNNEMIVEDCSKLEKQIVHVLSEPISSILGDGCSLPSNKTIRPLFKPILIALRPKLLKDTWKRYPAAMECFYWLLTISKPNRLCDHMPHILPTALLLIDDFDTDNQILGVKCVSRILDDMTLAEMKFHGYGLLIYKALEVSLRDNDPNLASYVLPCIMRVVTKLDTDLQGNRDITQWSQFDDIAEIILDKMAIEQKLLLRKVYMNFVRDLIHAVRGRILRWAKRLLLIFGSYIKTAGSLQDFENMADIYEVMALFIQATKEVRTRTEYRNSVLINIMLGIYFVDKWKPESSERIVVLMRSNTKHLFDGCSEERVIAIMDEIGSGPFCEDVITKGIFEKIRDISLSSLET